MKLLDANFMIDQIKIREKSKDIGFIRANLFIEDLYDKNDYLWFYDQEIAWLPNLYIKYLK